MNILSRRLQQMTYSKTLEMSAKARLLKSQGIKVINLSVGEPDFTPFKSILEYAKQSIDEGHHHYTPVPGYLELRKKIVSKFKRDNNIIYNPDQIVVSNGCKQSIINVFLSLLNDDDEVIIPAPYWVSYYEMVKLCHAIPVIVNTNVYNDFKITPKLLEQNITKNTKAFIFSSPCNPTGSVYSKSELYDLSKVFSKHPNIIIISDEIYEYINYTDNKHFSIASLSNVYNQTVTLNGLSKSFAMTGWRVGYMGGPLWISKACEKIQGQMTSGINAIAQCAAIKALDIKYKHFQGIIKTLKNKRDLAYSLLSNIKGFKMHKPQGAFYIFIDISFFIGKKLHGVYINNADDLAMLILDTVHVATVGGGAFGNDKYLRLSYATSIDNLIISCKKIKDLLI